MEVRHDEVAVGDLPVERQHRHHHTGDPSEEEDDEEPESEQHRRREAHDADPDVATHAKTWTVLEIVMMRPRR